MVNLSRNHDYRNMAQKFGSADSSAHLHTVHDRHHHIRNDEVRHDLLGLTQSFCTVGSKIKGIRRIKLPHLPAGNLRSILNDKDTGHILILGQSISKGHTVRFRHTYRIRQLLLPFNLRHGLVMTHRYGHNEFRTFPKNAFH